MKRARLVEIGERSRISQCRRIAKSQARHFGFSEVEAEKVGLAVTEAVSNVVRHAGHGWCVMQPIRIGSETCIEVLVWDDGPGIPDIVKCMKDGYSGADGPGNGLGAIKRLTDNFDIISKPKGGLCLSFRVWRNEPVRYLEPVEETGKMRSELDLFAAALTMPGEKECGDAWGLAKWGAGMKILLVDGLGHGEKAAEAANRAQETFEKVSGESGETILKFVNKSLHGTRGAVGAIAEIDVVQNKLFFTGIGNISARLFAADGNSSHLVSKSGLLGSQSEMRSTMTFEHPFEKGSALMMYSDGLSSRWNLMDLPGIAFRTSSLIGTAALSLGRKATDDCSIVVARLA